MAERTRYLVSYDICDPKRLRKVAKICEGFGYRLQFSVFECFLDPLRYREIQKKLREVMHHEEDQVLFVALGKETGERGVQIEALGLPYHQQPRVIVI